MYDTIENWKQYVGIFSHHFSRSQLHGIEASQSRPPDVPLLNLPLSSRSKLVNQPLPKKGILLSSKLQVLF